LLPIFLMRKCSAFILRRGAWQSDDAERDESRRNSSY
jgi:hypothetical protein